jgi:hypothetical protein
VILRPRKSPATLSEKRAGVLSSKALEGESLGRTLPPASPKPRSCRSRRSSERLHSSDEDVIATGFLGEIQRSVGRTKQRLT